MPRREFFPEQHVYLTGEGRKLFRVNLKVGETKRHVPVYSVTQLTATAGQYETFEASASRMKSADQTNTEG